MRSLLVVMLVLLAVSGGAQDAPNRTAPQTTASESNGRRWQILSAGEKLAWLDGYDNGLKAALYGPYEPAEGREALAARLRKFLPDKLSFGETRSALDRFYETPENRPVPISLGVFVVVLNEAGVPQSEIEESISAFRRFANRDAPE
jgi:hypothetical protein